MHSASLRIHVLLVTVSAGSSRAGCAAAQSEPMWSGAADSSFAGTPCVCSGIRFNAHAFSACRGADESMLIFCSDDGMPMPMGLGSAILISFSGVAVDSESDPGDWGARLLGNERCYQAAELAAKALQQQDLLLPRQGIQGHLCMVTA